MSQKERNLHYLKCLNAFISHVKMVTNKRNNFEVIGWLLLFLMLQQSQNHESA